MARASLAGLECLVVFDLQYKVKLSITHVSTSTPNMHVMCVCVCLTSSLQHYCVGVINNSPFPCLPLSPSGADDDIPEISNFGFKEFVATLCTSDVLQFPSVAVASFRMISGVYK